MTVKEFYETVGGDYEDVMSRLRTDERVVKFLNKVAADGSFALLQQSLSDRNIKEAFRAAHTLKGICMNLSLTRLYRVAAELTEALRGRSEFGEDIIPMFDALKTEYERNVNAIKSVNL